MTASDLLLALRECGAAVSVDGDELVVRAPRGALSPDLRVAVARLKPALMAELQNRDSSDNIDALTKRAGQQASTPTCLPPVHDVDDPWLKPTAPCMACGQVRWRVWSVDGGETWQWICNRCRPLVVHNRDGTVWRSNAP